MAIDPLVRQISLAFAYLPRRHTARIFGVFGTSVWGYGCMIYASRTTWASCARMRFKELSRGRSYPY